jgi:hypothetical protein
LHFCFLFTRTTSAAQRQRNKQLARRLNPTRAISII